jgi:hypothetical protein
MTAAELRGEPKLQVDRKHIARFVDLLFRHASPDLRLASRLL